MRAFPEVGDRVVLWGKRKHGPILEAELVELTDDSDECIGNPEWWCTIVVRKVLNDERAGDVALGCRLRFRAPFESHGPPTGRGWRPTRKALLCRLGNVSIVKREDPEEVEEL